MQIFLKIIQYNISFICEHSISVHSLLAWSPNALHHSFLSRSSTTKMHDLTNSTSGLLWYLGTTCVSSLLWIFIAHPLTTCAGKKVSRFFKNFDIYDVFPEFFIILSAVFNSFMNRLIEILIISTYFQTQGPPAGYNPAPGYVSKTCNKKLVSSIHFGSLFTF